MYRNVYLSLHLIAVISWMAGILYLYRLLVYHAAESEAVVRDRFKVMERRLYRYITMPAMGVAFIAGVCLIAGAPDYYLRAGWFHAKFALVLGMIAVTILAGRSVKNLVNDRPPFSERAYRILNEVPTLLMIVIVVLVVFKP